MASVKIKKALPTVIRILLTLCAFGGGTVLLYRYEYFAEAAAIDNLIGILPVAFVLAGAGALTATVWMKHTKRFAPLSVFLAVIVIMSAALFPNALRGNWWISRSSSSVADQPDLSVYAPFVADSKAAKLDGEPSLKLSSDLPLLDGATAFYPVYAAFAQATYNRDAYSEDRVICTKTNKAYRSIIEGSCDIIFTLGPSESQTEAAKAAGAELVYTSIAKEAFVFLVGGENPVEGLTYRQIRNIYSGKTSKWSTLGWREGGDIIAFQRPEGSGSQTGLQNVMGDIPIQAPQPLPDASLIGTNSLMKQVSVEWNGVQPALGYSYRYFATTMYANPDTKLLKIDGVYPSPENIRSGEYPFIFDVYAVTNGRPKGNTKLLIDWILSPQGRELIEKTGYTPVGG